MIYCHKRITIEGMERGETYCMLSLDHEGPCQKVRIVRDNALPLNERYYRAKKFSEPLPDTRKTQASNDKE